MDKITNVDLEEEKPEKGKVDDSVVDNKEEEEDVN
jgi:hypothetical protein